MNIELASNLAAQLYARGVREFIICAGARNAPLVKVLHATPEFKNLHFYDERAAGFFALGRARALSSPVAVVTTSGTAVAELLPAVVEAFYSGVPLVLVTADRPQSFRGTGAPQVIDQVRIFSNYAAFYDVENQKTLADITLEINKPTHINVCFSEPLIDAEIKAVVLPQKLIQEKPICDSTSSTHNTGESQTANVTRALHFLKTAQRPLFIVGGLNEQVRGLVYEYLRQTQRPVILESISGLRESEALAKLKLKSGGALFQKVAFRDHFDSVIRIGSVPTLRLWRDLEDKYMDVPVLSVDPLGFSGLARTEGVVTVSIETFFAATSDGVQGPSRERRIDSQLYERDEQIYSSLEQIMARYAWAEPAAIRWLSEQIPARSHIFLGNSLPIREWDLAAVQEDKNFVISANRGANGIDGLIATFLGGASADVENWLILGDLSALYDLGALAFMTAASSLRLRIVVVNNYGGQIFKNMFHDKNFINSHQFSFQNWAAMFGWKYICTDRKCDLLLQSVPTVIELRPQERESEKFDHDWREVLQT